MSRRRRFLNAVFRCRHVIRRQYASPCQQQNYRRSSLRNTRKFESVFKSKRRSVQHGQSVPSRRASAASSTPAAQLRHACCTSFADLSLCQRRIDQRMPRCVSISYEQPTRRCRCLSPGKTPQLCRFRSIASNQLPEVPEVSALLVYAQLQWRSRR